MFAIIRDGGKQYKVRKGDRLTVEKKEISVGDTIDISHILLLGSDNETIIGNPCVDNAKVVAVVSEHIKDKKVIIFKKKRRHQYRRKKGHRQHKTILMIQDIILDGKAVGVTKPKKPRPETLEKEPKTITESKKISETQTSSQEASKKKVSSGKTQASKQTKASSSSQSKAGKKAPAKKSKE